MRLLLKNLRVSDGGADRPVDLRLARGRILERGTGLAPRRRERACDAQGALALPGLINAHDHLGLDLLPRLGSPPYGNFYEWAREIYRPRERPIADVMRVDLEDRLRWGGYRNLVAGVTTVAHHDPPYRQLFRRSFPVRVLRRYSWSHSLGYGDDPATTFRRRRGRPFFIHAAEGTDDIAAAELDELDRRGMLGSSTVLIHAIGASSRQLARLAEVGTSVVWCPASNQWLYGRTVEVGALVGRTPVAIGTDSTLSGSPTLFDELRAAEASGLVSHEDLLKMVTTWAAAVLRLEDGRGTLETGAPADVLVLAGDEGDGAKALCRSSSASLRLVVLGGRPRLADREVAESLGLGEANVGIEGEARWLAGDVVGLRERIRSRVDRKILGANPVWRLLRPLESSHEPPTSSR